MTSPSTAYLDQYIGFSLQCRATASVPTDTALKTCSSSPCTPPCSHAQVHAPSTSVVTAGSSSSRRSSPHRQGGRGRPPASSTTVTEPARPVTTPVGGTPSCIQRRAG